MKEVINLIVLALKTATLAAAFTVLLLLAFDAGSMTLHIAFLAIGLLSFAISNFIQTYYHDKSG